MELTDEVRQKIKNTELDDEQKKKLLENDHDAIRELGREGQEGFAVEELIGIIGKEDDNDKIVMNLKKAIVDKLVKKELYYSILGEKSEKEKIKNNFIALGIGTDDERER